MRFDVLTLFPAIFDGFVQESLVADAVRRGLVEVRFHQLRDWAFGKHQSVDDRPFGGGPGMVLRADVVVPAIEAIRDGEESGREAAHVVLLSPQGRRFEQSDAERFSAMPRILLVCGRYEGFDERITEHVQPEELSIGDFVLNGGEVAAMAVIEATFRLLPDVLGHARSSVEDSFSGTHRWLDFPQYTRPRTWRGSGVPEILIGGDHGAVAQWREAEQIRRTRERRPDLFERFGYPEPPPPRKKRRRRSESPDIDATEDENGAGTPDLR